MAVIFEVLLQVLSDRRSPHFDLILFMLFLLGNIIVLSLLFRNSQVLSFMLDTFGTFEC